MEAPATPTFTEDELKAHAASELRSSVDDVADVRVNLDPLMASKPVKVTTSTGLTYQVPLPTSPATRKNRTKSKAAKSQPKKTGKSTPGKRKRTPEKVDNGETS